VVEIVSLFTGEAPAPAHTREAKCTAIILYCIIYIYIYLVIYLCIFLFGKFYLVVRRPMLPIKLNEEISLP
jgi:hypothetical protein